MVLKHNFHKMGNKRNVKTNSLTFEGQIESFQSYTHQNFSDIVISELNTIKRMAYLVKTKNKLMPRSVFFASKDFLCQLCDKNMINFDYHLNRTTKPKNIKYKYLPWQRLTICNYCFSNIEAGNFYDYTSIWLEIRKSHKLSIYGNFDTISLKTFKKIISLDLRYTKKAVKPYQPKHPIRTKVKGIGYMQMD